jgi:predicted GTPase
MLDIIENYPPPSLKGKYIKIKYATQLPGRTPMFAFFCNLPQYIKDPYKRFIENKLREHFEVDRHFVALATLVELARDGKVGKDVPAQAIAKYGINPNKPNPPYA